MLCCIIDSMKKVNVHEKGVDWIVCEDGSILRPTWTSFTTRHKNGANQNFVSVHKERVLTPTLNSRGYFEVSAKIGDKRPKMSLHRLIAIAFVPGFKDGLTVNHINGNKLDNRPENLEWVTLAENSKHEWQTGLVDLRGEKAPGHKLTQRQVIHIRRALKAGIPGNSLSIIAGVDPSTIHLIQKGKRWASLTDK
jgi:hypothetical protein